MRSIPQMAVACAILLVQASCDKDSGAILSLDATGTVQGTVFLDRNGDGEMTAGVDQAAPGMQVALVRQGTTRAVAQATTNASGAYSLPAVPVGTYEVTIDSQSLGDSLTVTSIDPSQIELGAGQTATVAVAVDRPVLPIATVRDLAVGQRAAIEGIALSAANNFGDASIHVEDESGWLRAVRIPVSAAQVGDRMRLTGTVQLRDGQPVLDQPLITLLGEAGEEPEPVAATSSRAASADGGRLDAALVRVAGAKVVDVRSGTGGSTRVVIDDGSGMLDVILTPAAGVTTEVPLVPGVSIAATGVLVPAGTAWQLRPRSSEDIVITLPTPTIAQFRALPLGTLVSLEGTALTAVTNFNDGTLHLADTSGSLRVSGVTELFIFAGDRVRIIGSVAASNGQPFLASSNADPYLLGKRPIPAPVVLNAADANSAKSGTLDAALVRVGPVTVRDTATVGTDFRATVEDASGTLEVIFDGDSGISISTLRPGVALTVTGVLIPTNGGRRWLLKPRSSSDVVR